MISVFIPTYRRPQDLRRCLEALGAQTRPADEVVVVVRDTDTETRATLADCPPSLPGLRVVTVSQPGVLAAMTVGLAETRGNIIALTDDDTAPYSDWLERIEAHFAADPQVGGVGGRDWQPVERGNREIVGIIQWHGRIIGNHHLGIGDARAVNVLKGANCAYRAEPLKRIGFESRLRGGGAQVHWEIALGLAMQRDGWKLIYDPSVALDHFPARRFDADQNLRGTFSAEGIQNSAYNETFILLSAFPLVRKIAYLLWVFLAGTRGEPGLAQLPRLFLKAEHHIMDRTVATFRGRTLAIQSVIRAKKMEKKNNRANRSFG